MFLIREKQLQVLADVEQARLVQEMVERVRRHLPHHFDALGPERTQRAVEYGIDRARFHGIVSVPGVTAYVQLLFVLGPDFDSDPQLPWVPEILKEGDENTRIQRLLAGAQEYLARKTKALEG